MVLPPKACRSSGAQKRNGKTIGRAGGHVLPDRVISYPNIFVEVGKRPYGGSIYAKCQIKTKRKFYRYLVWKYEGKQFSRYMGKVKILAPLSHAGAGGRPARRGRGSRCGRGAGK
jgi:hypothetical protein